MLRCMWVKALELMSKLSSIDRQVAVITGGTLGIGLACAERFLAEGARVAIIGRNKSHGDDAVNSLKKISPDVIYIQADCTKSADIDDAFRRIDEMWGDLHILVNCIGGFLVSPKIDGLSEEDWRKGIDWNLTSKFLTVKAALPYMKKNSYGRIVNISSVAGRGGVVAAPIDYSAAKAGVVVLTQRLAVELARFGITANVVAPGTTRTPRVAALTHRRMEDVIARIPVGRLGESDEIAHAILYFCTPGAGFTTGAVLDVNGGVWTGA